MTERDNSRPLDVHRWSKYEEVNSFVYQLWDDEISPLIPTGKRGPDPIQEPKYQFKVLVLDLYVAWKQDPTLRIGVGMSDRFYSVNSRYNALHLSAIMIKLVYALRDRGYIGLKKGTEGSGKVTRIWPSRKLIRLFESAKFSEYDVGTYEEAEVIVLNGKDFDEITGKGGKKRKSKPIEYEDSDYETIQEMRQDLRAYNALLHETFIDIEGLDTPVIKRTYWDSKTNTERYRKVFIRQNNKLVRRIFYRGSWALGGRFHGGWHQQIDSDARKSIMIDDQPTIEVDYSGLHISLIHCLEGQSPPVQPYTLPPTFTGYGSEEQRNVVKELVLCAINAKSRNAACQAFRSNQEQGSKEKSLRNAELSKLLDDFIKHNPAVEGYIAKDKGVELMKLDGDITAYIIKHFTNNGVPILTVHDSYIVPQGKEAELKEVMQSAIRQVLGNYDVSVKQNVYLWSQVLNSDFQPIEAKVSTTPGPLRRTGYEERRDNFWAWKESRQKEP